MIYSLRLAQMCLMRKRDTFPQKSLDRDTKIATERVCKVSSWVESSYYIPDQVARYIGQDIGMKKM